MIKRIKKFNVLAIAVLAGLLITLTSVDAMATESSDAINETVISVLGCSVSSLTFVGNIDEDNKCGEGKCGTATKEKNSKSEKKEVTEKKEGEVTSEKKCGEGKCGAAEKKEGKAKKESSKKETKEGKCGTGKCGVA